MIFLLNIIFKNANKKHGPQHVNNTFVKYQKKSEANPTVDA